MKYKIIDMAVRLKNKNKNKNKDNNLKRTNRHTIYFNNHEFAAISRFCNKYKVSNRSKFMREAIITEILKKFDDDYPSLFEDQGQMRLF